LKIVKNKLFKNFSNLKSAFANNLIEQAKVQVLKFSIRMNLSIVPLSGLLSLYYCKYVLASFSPNYPKDRQSVMAYKIKNATHANLLKHI
jgi:hypothetical protein